MTFEVLLITITLALSRINQSGQHTYLHHSGGTGGFRSFIGFNPDRRIAIIVFSNAAEEVTTIGEGFLK